MPSYNPRSFNIHCHDDKEQWIVDADPSIRGDGSVYKKFNLLDPPIQVDSKNAIVHACGLLVEYTDVYAHDRISVGIENVLSEVRAVADIRVSMEYKTHEQNGVLAIIKDPSRLARHYAAPVAYDAAHVSSLFVLPGVDGITAGSDDVRIPEMSPTCVGLISEVSVDNFADDNEDIIFLSYRVGVASLFQSVYHDRTLIDTKYIELERPPKVLFKGFLGLAVPVSLIAMCDGSKNPCLSALIDMNASIR